MQTNRTISPWLSSFLTSKKLPSNIIERPDFGPIKDTYLREFNDSHKNENLKNQASSSPSAQSSIDSENSSDGIFI